MSFPGDLDRSGGPAKQLKYEGPSVGWINNYNPNPDATGANLQVPTTDGSGNLTFQTPPGGGGGVAYPEFNVKTYGATGNGSTDDTFAINSAIAAFNSAGGGQIYFPTGTYKVTLPLTTITAKGIIFGDGGNAGANTTINYTSTNTICFNCQSPSLLFRDIVITGSQVATSGCIAIQNQNHAGANSTDKVCLDGVVISGFYDAFDTQIGQGWFIDNSVILNFVHFGVRANNALQHDAGGWTISNTGIVGLSESTTAAGISFESAGGDHISNCNFLHCQRAIWLHNSILTADMLITNCSLEICGTYHIDADYSSAGGLDNLVVHGCEFDGSGTAAIHAAPNGSVGWVFSALTLTGGQILFSSGTPFNTLVIGLQHGSIAGPVGSSGFTDATGGVGGQQFFTYLVPFTSGVNNLTWTNPGGGNVRLEAATLDPSRTTSLRATNNTGHYVEINQDGSTSGTGSYVQSDADLKLCSDAGVTSGGSDPVSIRAGGNGPAAEVFQAIPAGLLKMTNAANFSANGAVATVLGSVGPTGSHTAVQKWLTVEDSAGAKFYIPCF